MKKTKSSFALGISMCALIAHPANAVEHSSKLVSELQAVNPTTDCFFFRLEGVAQADPVKPNDPWFAMSRSHSGATATFALLLAARVSGLPLSLVATTGQLVCGYAQVASVLL
jgi:hypothetical protein